MSEPGGVPMGAGDEVPESTAAGLPPAVKRTGLRRYWPVIAAAVAVVVAAVVVVVVVATASGGDGPADRFEQAAESFHSQSEPLEKKLKDSLPQAKGFGDPAFTQATTSARALADLYTSYDKDLQAIAVPEKAGGVRVGSVRRTGVWSGEVAADLPGLSLPVQIFVLGVVITMWQRQSSAAAAGSSGA